MNHDRYLQIVHLFEAALEHGPDERTAFLDKACAGDQELRALVQEYLDTYQQQTTFLMSPAVFSPSGQNDPMIGKSISHYEIQQLLGEGGMGKVYRATDKKLGRKVALKILLPKYAADEQIVERFKQEAHALASFNHPNIAIIHEAEQADGYYYIITELLEGQMLSEYKLKKGKMPPQQVIAAAIQIADALEASRLAGIIHRDIKPQNIMLLKNGAIKIFDFGIAKLTRQSAHPAIITEPGIRLGTPFYMSPEQINLEKIDARTDIFSLGIVLYELVTGVLPFTGNDVGEVFTSILKKEPPPIKKYAPEAPVELQQIINKALRKNRDERYQTFADLLVALEAVPKDAAPPITKKRLLLRGIVTAAVVVSLAIAAIIIWYFRKPSTPMLPVALASKLSVTSVMRARLVPIKGSPENPIKLPHSGGSVAPPEDKQAPTTEENFRQFLNRAYKYDINDSEQAFKACGQYRKAYDALPQKYKSTAFENLIYQANRNFLAGKYVIAANHFEKAFKQIPERAFKKAPQL